MADMDGWTLLSAAPPATPRLVGRPILCLTDIAGDLAALESVLSAVKQQRLAGIIACGNHVVGGPQPFEVWTRLQSLGAALTCGPTDLVLAAIDRHALDELAGRGGPDVARLEAFVRARQALGDVISRRLGELPSTTVVSLDDTRGVMALHGSPADDDAPLIDDDQLVDRVAAVAEDVLVCATGRPFARRLSLPSVVPTLDDEGGLIGVSPPRGLLVVGLGLVGTPVGLVPARRRTAQAMLVGAGDDGGVHAWGAEVAVSQRRSRRAV
jgi:hypothetical protein